MMATKKYKEEHEQLAKEAGVSYEDVVFLRQRLVGENSYQTMDELFEAQEEKLLRYRSHILMLERTMELRDRQMKNPRNARWINDISMRKKRLENQKDEVEQIKQRVIDRVERIKALTEDQLQIILRKV